MTPWSAAQVPSAPIAIPARNHVLLSFFMPGCSMQLVPWFQIAKVVETLHSGFRSRSPWPRIGWCYNLLIYRGKCGRSERIRTSDPLVPNEVRYQAALHSDVATRLPTGHSLEEQSL